LRINTRTGHAVLIEQAANLGGQIVALRICATVAHIRLGVAGVTTRRQRVGLGARGREVSSRSNCVTVAQVLDSRDRVRQAQPFHIMGKHPKKKSAKRNDFKHNKRSDLPPGTRWCKYCELPRAFQRFDLHQQKCRRTLDERRALGQSTVIKVSSKDNIDAL
jgi:hypothetical protein